MFKQNFLDRFETRNVEIKINKKTLKDFDKLIFEIFNFELEWLRYKLNNPNLKKHKSKHVLKDYSARIQEIKKRIMGMRNISIQ